jgi:thymidylate synthase (FAD)
MSTEITLTDQIRVELVRSSANDLDVVHSARVSTLGDQLEEDLERSASDVERDKGLIAFLMRNRHGTPFEHNSFTFRVTAPIFVWREHMRHRVGFSYNEESARYRELQPVFYAPSHERAIVQVGTPGEYRFEVGFDEQYELIDESFEYCFQASYSAYEDLLASGVAREVARMVLPTAIMTTAYVTCNARSLMSFLSLRTFHEDSIFPSYPQAEIEMVASQYEQHFAASMPLTYAAFIDSGRVAP